MRARDLRPSFPNRSPPNSDPAYTSDLASAANDDLLGYLTAQQAKATREGRNVHLPGLLRNLEKSVKLLGAERITTLAHMEELHRQKR